MTSVSFDTEAASALRLGVCAVDFFAEDPDAYIAAGKGAAPFEILGTGFLLSDTTVITNRHVIDALTNSGVARDRWHLMFVYPQRPDAVRSSYRPCGTMGTLVGPAADMGMIEFLRDTEEGFTQCVAPPIGDGFAMQVGTPVGVCGYLHGRALLELGHLGIHRFGPVVHLGIVSAVAPFDLPDSMVAFLTDIHAGGGLSGSPVFAPNSGKIVGIHFAGNKGEVGLALPLNAEARDVLVAAHQHAVEQAGRHKEHITYTVKITREDDTSTPAHGGS